MAQEETETGIVMTPEDKRRQRVRSLVIAWGLVALVIIFFFATIIQMGANVMNRPL